MEFKWCGHWLCEKDYDNKPFFFSKKITVASESGFFPFCYWWNMIMILRTKWYLPLAMVIVWLLFFSFFVKAAEACQHCNTSWHYTHQRHPYVCLWVFGKFKCLLETSISSVFLTVYEFFFVFEIHHIPYHRYPLQKSFMALFFMDGRQDVV